LLAGSAEALLDAAARQRKAGSHFPTRSGDYGSSGGDRFAADPNNIACYLAGGNTARDGIQEEEEDTSAAAAEG